MLTPGRAGLLVTWKQALNQQRLRPRRASEASRAAASGGGAPRAVSNADRTPISSMTVLMRYQVVIAVVFCNVLTFAQGRGPREQSQGPAIVLRPAHVFDGVEVHDGWAVRVRGDRIEAAGPAAS